jgi:hypothetical protein
VKVKVEKQQLPANKEQASAKPPHVTVSQPAQPLPQQQPPTTLQPPQTVAQNQQPLMPSAQADYQHQTPSIASHPPAQSLLSNANQPAISQPTTQQQQQQLQQQGLQLQNYQMQQFQAQMQQYQQQLPAPLTPQHANPLHQNSIQAQQQHHLQQWQQLQQLQQFQQFQQSLQHSLHGHPANTPSTVYLTPNAHVPSHVLLESQLAQHLPSQMGHHHLPSQLSSALPPLPPLNHARMGLGTPVNAPNANSVNQANASNPNGYFETSQSLKLSLPQQQQKMPMIMNAYPTPNNPNPSAPMPTEPVQSYATPQSSAVPLPSGSTAAASCVRRNAEEANSKPGQRPEGSNGGGTSTNSSSTTGSKPTRNAGEKENANQGNQPLRHANQKRSEASSVSTFIDLQGSASPLLGMEREEPVGFDEQDRDDDVDLMHDWLGERGHAVEVVRLLSSESSSERPSACNFHYRVDYEDGDEEAENGHGDGRPSPKPTDGYERHVLSGDDEKERNRPATGAKRCNSDELESNRVRGITNKPSTTNDIHTNATAIHVQSIVINLTNDSGLVDDEPDERRSEKEKEAEKESETDRLRRTKRKRRHDSGHAHGSQVKERNEEAINLDTHTSHTELLGMNGDRVYCLFVFCFLLSIFFVGFLLIVFFILNFIIHSLLGPHKKKKKRLTLGSSDRGHRSDKREKDGKRESNEPSREKKRRTSAIDNIGANSTTGVAERAPVPTMNALDILGAEHLPVPGKGVQGKALSSKRGHENQNNISNNSDNYNRTLALPASSPSALLSPLLPLHEVLAGVVLYISKPLAQRQIELAGLGSLCVNLFVCLFFSLLIIILKSHYVLFE